MNDAIIAHLRENPQGLPSLALAEMFLKFRSPDPTLAHRAVSAILDKDRRCRYGPDGLWHARQEPQAATADTIRSSRWAAVHVLASGPQPVHVSAWSVFPKPALVGAHWLIDPDSLPYDEQVQLRCRGDSAFDRSDPESAVVFLARSLGGFRPVLLSLRHQSLLAQRLAAAGETPPDNAILVSQLFRAAGLALPRPLELDQCYRVLFSCEPSAVPARQRGELLAECTAELADRLAREGIETAADLDRKGEEEVAAFDFTGKAFCYDDLRALPDRPGVYGFKDQGGRYLYIGKANSLRQRVCGYFRKTDESPAKLSRLRSDSHALMFHVCGSELESLLYEHRLIDRHRPVLNTQAQVNERKGSYRPLPDCVILLPHTDEGKGMSFWFRSGQRVLMKAFFSDFHDRDALVSALDEFFFSIRLSPLPTDFPEQELTYRWVKRRSDALLIVPVDRYASAVELFEGIRSYWPAAQGT